MASSSLVPTPTPFYYACCRGSPSQLLFIGQFSDSGRQYTPTHPTNRMEATAQRVRNSRYLESRGRRTRSHHVGTNSLSHGLLKVLSSLRGTKSEEYWSGLWKQEARTRPFHHDLRWFHHYKSPESPGFKWQFRRDGSWTSLTTKEKVFQPWGDCLGTKETKEVGRSLAPAGAFDVPFSLWILHPKTATTFVSSP